MPTPLSFGEPVPIIREVGGEVKQKIMIKLFQNKIDILLKNLNDPKLKSQVLQSLPFWFASLLTGLVAYLYYVLFSYTEDLSIFIIQQNKYFIFILTPTTFLLSWFLVKKYAPNAKGSGIPQVMAAIELSTPQKKHLADYLLNFKIIIVKILSSLIKVLGGGILGREGPTIQISSSIFMTVYKYLPASFPKVSQRNMIMAGAASGLAAAFNTPLGGIIFAIEELSKYHIKYYKSSLFTAVIIAGLAAQGLAGSYLYLGYPKLQTEGISVVFGVILVAAIAGFLGSYSSVLLLKLMKFVSLLKSNAKQVYFILFCSMIVASSIYFFGTDAMGSGKEIMERTLFTADKKVEWYIPFVRITGLLSTFSFGGAGGIFAPSLSSGASVGSVVAGLLGFTGSNANMLIIIGMTAFLTGVTKSPFTSAIIILEMTDRHSVIFFLMIAGIIANITANLVDKKSFYDHLKEVYIHDTENKEK